MSSFTKPLVYARTAKFRGGRAVYVLREPFVYELGFEGSEIKVTVPAGFETDFASIPAFADKWFGLDPTDGIVKKAAVIHDFLYANKHFIESLIVAVCMLTGHDVTVSPRAFADRIFFEAMGVPRKRGFSGLIQTLRRYLIFWTVRLFGGRAFASLNHSQLES